MLLLILRFDDTNPAKEEQQYVEAIKENIQWLGYQWDKECYASDYFDTTYRLGKELIKKGLAYVDSQTSEEISQPKRYTNPSRDNSPFRIDA